MGLTEHEGPVSIERLGEGAYLIRAVNLPDTDEFGLGLNDGWQEDQADETERTERRAYVAKLRATHAAHPYRHGLSSGSRAGCETCGLLPGAFVHVEAVRAE
jgi:hypothetical protein